MKNLKKYESGDRMISIISDNYNILQSLGAFGINLGFGDKTVQEVCEEQKVDTYTFLAVVNFTINDLFSPLFIGSGKRDVNGNRLICFVVIKIVGGHDINLRSFQESSPPSPRRFV